MSTKDYMEARKLFLLDQINNKKNDLFGKFTANLTDKVKQQTWQEILKNCSTAGYEMVPPTCKIQPWKYLRDTVWASNIKKRTLDKRDKKTKRTGFGGGKEMIYAKVDLMVLEILGGDSAVVSGLSVTESGGQFLQYLMADENKENANQEEGAGASNCIQNFNSPVAQALAVQDSNAGPETLIPVTVTPSRNLPKQNGLTSFSRPVHKKRSISELNSEVKKDILDMNKLKKRNLELDAELKELQKRKLLLEIETLERNVRDKELACD